MRTPWGVADQVDVLDEGVYSVSTPSHGGIMVLKTVGAALLSKRARQLMEESPYGGTYGSYYCFEEDCNWALVGYEHPELLEKLYDSKNAVELKQIAEQTLRRYLPAYFEEAV